MTNIPVQHEHRTYKVAIKNNIKPTQKTRTLSNGKVILTEKESFKRIKNI